MSEFLQPGLRLTSMTNAIPPSGMAIDAMAGNTGTRSAQIFDADTGYLLEVADMARFGWLLDGLKSSGSSSRGTDLNGMVNGAGHIATPNIGAGLNLTSTVSAGQTTQPDADDDGLANGLLIDWNSSFRGFAGAHAARLR